MSVTSVSSVSSLPSTTSTTAAATTDVDGLPVAFQSTISPEGGLFGQLASLAQSDPADFKQVAGEISQKLSTAASQATGDQAKFLTSMADKFGQAAQTGDMSALKPPGAEGTAGAQGHHHHHHHASTGQDSNGSQSSSSPFQAVSQAISSALQGVTGSASTSVF